MVRGSTPAEISSWDEPLSEYRNVSELLDDRAAEYGEKRYAVFPQKNLTFAELARRSKRLAAGLTAKGIEPGDHVAAMMYNHPAFVELFFAVARVGAVLVPVNVSLRGDDLSYTLTDAAPKAIIVGSQCVEKYREVEQEVAIPMSFSTADDADGFVSLESVYIESDIPDATVSQSDPLTTIYTSGTTGMPKGVVLPNGAYLTVGTELAERVIQPADEDVLYMSQPLFHIFAQLVMMEALVAGVPFAMEKWFSKSKFWDRVEKHDATVIHFSSAISQILYQETEAPNNSVRIAYGAIEDDVQKPFCEKFDCQVIPLYGLSESGGLSLSGTVDEPCLGSLGQPMSYTDVTIVDENDVPVGPNENGEILVRATRPNVLFQEYYSNPEATVEVLGNQWLHTGDIGYRDEDGGFHFVERKSYFIRRKGENVSAFEVERIINEHPDVRGAAVAGVDSELGGEEVFAAVKLHSDAKLDPLEIIKHCEGRLAYFKIPRFVTFVDEFPKTETKETIQRFKLLEKHAESAWDLEQADYTLER